jgi:simple sugar transport system ATP-binding protein
VIFISHKLPEIIDLCDRVTVLRDGEVVGRREISAGDRLPGADRVALEAELAQMMVGRQLPAPPARGGEGGPPLLVVAGAVAGVVSGAGGGGVGGARRRPGPGRPGRHEDRPPVGPIDLEVRAGEILGVAGVEGNGQTELVELLLGVRPCVRGRITLDGDDITSLSVAKRLRSGIAHIAEDRHAAALAMRMSLVANAALGFQGQRPFARRQYWLSGRKMGLFARSLVRRFRVRATSVAVPARSLSGGNQQKLVVGRELARKPRLMIATQPTRGLDVGAAAFVHRELAALTGDGQAVLLISLDLAEIMALADRLVVLFQGQVVGEGRPGQLDLETIGAWMTGGHRP